MKSSLFRGLGAELSHGAGNRCVAHLNCLISLTQRKSPTQTEAVESAMLSHLCGQVVPCWPWRCPRESSSSRWSRCCPGLRRPRSSRRGRTHRSSPRRSAGGWRVSRKGKVFGGNWYFNFGFKGNPMQTLNTKLMLIFESERHCKGYSKS